MTTTTETEETPLLLTATLNGITGYLLVELTGQHYRYGVTLENAKATSFRSAAAAARHARRATAAGLTVTI